jgi:hypothetical protein
MRYARDGALSLRAFQEGNKPYCMNMWAVPACDPRYVVDVAVDIARRAANEPKPVVFCPPVVTVKDGKKAAESDVLAAYTLTVESDHHCEHARHTLEELLGPATVVVKSGGVWLNGGEPEDKLHLH